MRASLEQHLGSRQVGRVVYGSIIGLALVVALESHPPKPSVMAVWLAGTALAVGLAEVYSEIVGTETSTRQSVTRRQVGHMVEDAVAVGFGVAFPAAFFLLSALGLFEVETAFTIAKWTGLALIGFYGFWAARFAGAAPHHAVLKGLLVALIGAGLIALKAFVH
jgi:VIT1/CCC1 family predicted Fe2+/Mn2+ transporter